jgi:hypothetical protein
MELVGMVTRDGRPVAGALVELMHEDGELFQVMYSGNDGRFRFETHLGRWVVGLTCEGSRRAKDLTLEGPQPGAYVHFDLSSY